MKIKRYNFSYNEIKGLEAKENSGGMFVNYEDYKRLWKLAQRLRPAFMDINLPEA